MLDPFIANTIVAIAENDPKSDAAALVRSIRNRYRIEDGSVYNGSASITEIKSKMLKIFPAYGNESYYYYLDGILIALKEKTNANKK